MGRGHARTDLAGNDSSVVGRLRFGPRGGFEVADVPLVEGQAERPFRSRTPRECGHQVGVVVDPLLEVQRLGDDCFVVGVPGVEVRARGIEMEREVVDEVGRLLEDGPGPLFLAPRDPYADELDRWVDLAHEPTVFTGGRGVRLGGAVSVLPRPVDLVAESPVADAVGLRVAVRGAAAGVGGVAAIVGVLHPAHGVLDVQTAVREIGLRTDLGAPGEELVGAEAVALLATPGEFQPAWALLARPDAVFPAVRRGEVAAWPAYDRESELPAQLEHVVAQAVACAGAFQREWGSFVEDAALDVAEEVRLEEVPVDVRVDPADLRLPVDGDRRLHGRRGGWRAGFLQRHVRLQESLSTWLSAAS